LAGFFQQTHCIFIPQEITSIHLLIFTSDLINDDIGPSANINWVATVFTLGNAVGFLLVGRLSDIFGRKWMVLATSSLGLIGNIIGCSARSVNTLIAANLCNGLAASGQLSFGIILGELVPNRQRGPIVALVFLSAVPFSGMISMVSEIHWEKESADEE